MPAPIKPMIAPRKLRRPTEAHSSDITSLASLSGLAACGCAGCEARASDLALVGISTFVFQSRLFGEPGASPNFQNRHRRRFGRYRSYDGHIYSNGWNALFVVNERGDKLFFWSRAANNRIQSAATEPHRQG
jgi:hypothetical protein